MSEHKEEPSRRELIQVAAGLGAAGALAAGGWGLLEWLLPPNRAAAYHKSTCRYCGTGCGIQVGITNGRVTDVRGDPAAPHNKGVICVKGATLPELMRAPGRLLRPRVRKNGHLVDTSWDEALDLLATRFKEYIAADRDSVAFYGSGQLLTEESYTANKLFKAGIGTNNVDGNPRLCMASAAAGYTSVFGKDEPPGCYEDIDFADCFFLIGANPYECHPPLMERIRRRKATHPQTRIICVDPRRTRTAELADLYLPVVPGTDLLLLNAMAQVIVDPLYRLWNQAFIDAHVRFSSDGKDVLSLDDFRKFLVDYTPEKVADRVGVSATQIRETAFLFASSSATMSLWTMGINQRTQGTFLNQMLSGLHLLTGQICRPGATPLSLTGQANACGGVRDTGALAHALPGGRLVANPKHRAEMEELWRVKPGTLSAQVGYHAMKLFQAVKEGKVKGLLVMCTNPAQSLPEAEQHRAALATLSRRGGLLVVADVFEDTETVKLADVVLPAALWIEKEGVYGQTERRYQLLEKLVEPPGEAKSDLWILVELAKRLGHGELIAARTPAEVWEEWRHVSAHSKYNFEGMTYDRLRREHGLQWPCPTEDSPGTKRRFVGGDDPLVARGKAIEFYGQEFPGDTRRHHRAVVFLRPYVPSPEVEAATKLPASAAGPLWLTTGRVLEQWHTGTMTGRVPELAKASGPGRFELNVQDARERGITDGDTIEVESRFGTMTGRAVVTDRPRRGVLFAPFYDAQFPINRVVAGHVDPTSFEPEFKVTAVVVRKAKEGQS